MSKRIEYIIDDIKEQYLEKDNNIPGHLQTSVA